MIWLIIALVAAIALAVDFLIIGGADPRRWKGDGKHGKR